MKKLYSIMAMAALALSSQAAIQVTYEGKAVTNGQEIALGKNSFEKVQDIVPGVLSIYKAEADLTVTGATPIKVSAQGTDQTFQYCTGDNCFSLSDLDGDGIYTHEVSINKSPETMSVDVNYSGPAVPETIKSTISFVLTDATGSSVNFKVSMDSSKDAGVDNISVDGDNTPTVYYNLNGVKATTLTPGIYIARQGHKTTKIIVK